jgi:hypothetical protein
LLVAGLFGWLTGSFMVFVIVLMALIVAGIHSGDLRA